MKPDLMDKDDHEETKRLLPWYATHSLSDSEVKTVEKHLAGCGECQNELLSCQSLANYPPVTNEMWSPSPAHFASILERVDAFEESRSASARPDKAKSKKRFLSGLMDSFASIPKPLQWAFALETAVCFGIVLMVAASFYKHLPIDQSYQTLSSQEETAKVGGIALRVLFAEEMAAGELAALLKQIHGQIRQGPSEVGSYVVEAPEANLAQTLAALRSHPKVKFVQQIAGDGSGQ